MGAECKTNASIDRRESLHLGLLLKIHVPDSYISLDLGEQERRLRTYWILCVTER